MLEYKVTRRFLILPAFYILKRAYNGKVPFFIYEGSEEISLEQQCTFMTWTQTLRVYLSGGHLH